MNELMIRRLWIRGYRGFKELKMDLHPNMTVIVGENGAGKSTLMEAFRLVMWAGIKEFGRNTAFWVPQNPVGDLHRELQGDMHVRAKDFFILASPDEEDWLDSIEDNDEACMSSNFGCRLDNNKLSWINLNPETITVFSKLMDLELDVISQFDNYQDNIQSSELPLVAIFDTSRLYRSNKNINLSDSRFRHYGYSGVFALKYKYITTERLFDLLDKRLSYAPDEKFFSLFTEIQKGVSEAIEIVSGWQSFRVEDNKDFLYRRLSGPYFKLTELGQGVQNIIQLVSELAVRCALLNPHLGQNAAKKTAGVVFIDEVDLHLHPSWQQTILLQLQQAFPKIQFIVTTHSPQVLTSVDKSCIRMLRRTTDSETGETLCVVEHVATQTKGVSSADLLARIMEVDPVPDMPEAWQLSEYHALIQQNLYESAEGQSLRGKLDSHFGIDHPLMLDCERMIRLQVFKQRLPRREA